MIRYALIATFCLSIAFNTACNGNEKTPEQDSELVDSASAKTSEPAKGGLPTIPNALMQTLVDSADYVDYLFYELEFSMSMDNKQGVMYALSKIGDASPTLNPACKPIGRIFYQIKGRNAAEADLYFSQGCTYLVFMENNVPVYANTMSDVGITFLNNQFAAIMKNYVPIE